jgi:UPF0042 nucleotide-binding protein
MNKPSDITAKPVLPATRVLLITGLSGAGKTSALKALEDLGYEAVDNLPLSLLPGLLKTDPESRVQTLAIGMDSRTRAFATDRFEKKLRALRARRDIELTLVFLDCSDEMLRRRFTETRRRHPLASDRPVQDGIDRERAMMARVRDRADLVLDTTDLTLHDLRWLMRRHFQRENSNQLTIAVQSFSYRRGLPRESDLVFDVRFLANPHYVETLKAHSGRDQDVAAYITADPVFADFFERLSGLILALLPHYRREGKSYLTISFGCTGGRHRSVFLAERLSAVLGENGYAVKTVHRDANLG